MPIFLTITLEIKLNWLIFHLFLMAIYHIEDLFDDLPILFQELFLGLSFFDLSVEEHIHNFIELRFDHLVIEYVHEMGGL